MRPAERLVLSALRDNPRRRKVELEETSRHWLCGVSVLTGQGRAAVAVVDEVPEFVGHHAGGLELRKIVLDAFARQGGDGLFEGLVGAIGFFLDLLGRGVSAPVWIEVAEEARGDELARLGFYVAVLDEAEWHVKGGELLGALGGFGGELLGDERADIARKSFRFSYMCRLSCPRQRLSVGSPSLCHPKSYGCKAFGSLLADD